MIFFDTVDKVWRRGGKVYEAIIQRGNLLGLLSTP